MKTLIVDSATNILYTALLIDEEVVYESYIEGKYDHASSISVQMEMALEKGKINVFDLDKVIVGYGPGSYTGVRMAVTVGKMIATLEAKIKLYTISTLLLMGSGYSGKVLASIDARHGNCFGCIYDMDSNEYLIKEGLMAKEKLMLTSHDYEVKEDAFKVNPFKVLSLAKEVLEPRTLVPNYLRDTEAERNLNG